MCQKLGKFLRNANNQLANVSGWITFSLLILGAWWGLDTYIKAKITSPEMIELVSARIRPIVIFDSEKKVVSGEAAMNSFLEDFDIKKDAKGIVTEIIITTKTLLNTPPVLDCLDDHFIINSEKGEKFKWIYKIEPYPALTFGKVPNVLRFRLEFVN